MGKTLKEIAQQLKDTNKKVQLIYGFNGVGKTRLSREFKELVASETKEDEEDRQIKVLYYNAFTEDLFYWDNDLEWDSERKLKIQPNSFTDWFLRDQGQDQNVITNFQRYVNDKLTPKFNPRFSEVTFSLERGTERLDDIKISKGEESNFIWSIFYTLLEQVITVWRDGDEKTPFDNTEYVFIDDPVTSLDENHLIELAVSLAKLVKSSDYKEGKGVKFIITTHNPLFYNVLCNEFSSDLEQEKPDGTTKKIYKKRQSEKYILRECADGTFQLENSGVNDRPFSYHLFLLSELMKLQSVEQVEKYHFNFLRNVLEKTATFLGYRQWNKLLSKLSEDDKDVINRLLNLYSHSAHSGEEVANLNDNEKEKFIKLVKDFAQEYNFAEMKRS